MANTESDLALQKELLSMPAFMNHKNQNEAEEEQSAMHTLKELSRTNDGDDTIFKFKGVC